MLTYDTKRNNAPQRGGQPQVKPPTEEQMLHLSGAGAPQPMSPALREKFEPGFSADFSNIRISRGHIPEELGIQAVAKGTDILLDSRAGMEVLGHELAHVVQQAQGRVAGGFPLVENAALEHEADVMGTRAASGLSAQVGHSNGFGGEGVTLSPMSSASAPAQCKSQEEKEMEKTQISEPTLLNTGTMEYQNEGLDRLELNTVRTRGASTQDVAVAQMLSNMNNPEYLAQIAQRTGSTPEEIKAKMGGLVGESYAMGALEQDPARQVPEGGEKPALYSREGPMFRANFLYQKNFAKFLSGELNGTAQQAVQNAQSGTLEDPGQGGEASASNSQFKRLDQNTVDQQADLLAESAVQSAPVMAATDSFFRKMREGGTDFSDERLEEKMSNEIFLRGFNPQIMSASAQQSGEGKEKIIALSRGLQEEMSDHGKAAHRNFLRGRAANAVAAPARPQTPAAAPAPKKKKGFFSRFFG